MLPDLYSGPDRFAWSGGSSDAARLLGGQTLKGWVNEHQADGVTVVAHHHGGSVAMLASQAGIRMQQLVLLSCPVWVPKYRPNFATVGRVIALHVRLDPVILADGGGQRFTHPQIDEQVLPVWFDHAATHDPGVWTAHDVPSLLA